MTLALNSKHLVSWNGFSFSISGRHVVRVTHCLDRAVFSVVLLSAAKNPIRSSRTPRQYSLLALKLSEKMSTSFD